MAYEGFIKTGTREKLMDIILWEQITGNGYSREVVAPAGNINYEVGDLLKSDGTKATKPEDIYGVCLNNYSASVGLTTSGQLNITMIVRQAELKSGGINLNGMDEAAVTTALKAKGINLVPTGK